MAAVLWSFAALLLAFVYPYATWGAALRSRVNPWVWGAGLLIALAPMAWQHRLIPDRAREGCFKAFRLNRWPGFTVFVGVVVGIGLR